MKNKIEQNQIDKNKAIEPFLQFAESFCIQLGESASNTVACTFCRLQAGFAKSQEFITLRQALWKVMRRAVFVQIARLAFSIGAIDRADRLTGVNQTVA